MEKPLVSVLVPIFNVEPWLRQCIESILAQTLEGIEVVLVDDGSTDGSAAIVDGFAAADVRVCGIHKPNSGYGDSLNRALEEAQGEWVAIVEPDDWVEPAMLEHLLAAAREHASVERPVDIVKGAYRRVIYEQGRESRDATCVHLDLVAPPHQPFTVDECPALLALHPSIWSALYRRAFLDEFGIRFKPIPGAGWADNPFFIETMVAARSIVWLAEEIYHYREFEDGTLSHLKDWRIITGRWAEMNEVLRAYDAQAPIILQAHACRGCAYLQMLLHDFDTRDPELQAAIRTMATSIDPRDVKNSPYVPAEYKRAFRRARRL